MVINKFAIVSHNDNGWVIFLEERKKNKKKIHINPVYSSAEDQRWLSLWVILSTNINLYLQIKSICDINTVKYPFCMTNIYSFFLKKAQGSFWENKNLYMQPLITLWIMTDQISGTDLAIIIKGVKEDSNSIPLISSTVNWTLKALRWSEPHSLEDKEKKPLKILAYSKTHFCPLLKNQQSYLQSKHHR